MRAVPGRPAGHPGIEIYGAGDARRQAAVVSFNLRGMDCAQAAFRLDREYGICMRAGLHCAPLAPRTVGSFPQGSLRASMGPFNTEAEIEQTLSALSALSR